VLQWDIITNKMKNLKKKAKDKCDAKNSSNANSCVFSVRFASSLPVSVDALRRDSVPYVT
jgi:hypothetical protein